MRMTNTLNRRWLIADRPLGRALREADFRLEDAPVLEPREGEVQVRTLWLGLDPSQKGFMENVASYADATSLGGVMPGTGVGQVVASRSPRFAVGDLVCGELGWQERPIVADRDLTIVRAGLPPTAALGTLGMTGRTAYFGLLHVGLPRPGDTLVVSGAAGAVGSVVGQIGKLAGCRVIGIAGGPAKCETLVRQLGFDAAIDYKAEKLRARLRELCPNGIDVLFDNVGGSVLNDALGRVAAGARVVICGGISRYGADPRKPEQLPPGPQNYFNVVFTRATITGFLVHHFAEHYATADRRLGEWLADGRLRQLEDVVEGFENAPRALMRLFDGANLGKQLLRMGAPEMQAAAPSPGAASA
jgi:NADPH-dependent curcumin reductase CurA